MHVRPIVRTEVLANAEIIYGKVGFSILYSLLPDYPGYLDYHRFQLSKAKLSEEFYGVVPSKIYSPFCLGYVHDHELRLPHLRQPIKKIQNDDHQFLASHVCFA